MTPLEDNLRSTYEWRITAHDPQTMRQCGGVSSPFRPDANVAAYEQEVRRTNPDALIVVARRWINLGKTNETGSWEIVRTVQP